jgi:hypothetical protein
MEPKPGNQGFTSPLKYFLKKEYLEQRINNKGKHERKQEFWKDCLNKIRNDPNLLQHNVKYFGDGITEEKKINSISRFYRPKVRAEIKSMGDENNNNNNNEVRNKINELIHDSEATDALKLRDNLPSSNDIRITEYLERKRASFPRFYFVDDEDLQEIIGNAKNGPQIQKHLNKMFAGVHSILLNEDNKFVLGVSSKEGEEVNT